MLTFFWESICETNVNKWEVITTWRNDITTRDESAKYNVTHTWDERVGECDVITCRPMPDAFRNNIVSFYLMSLFFFFFKCEFNLKRTCLRLTLQETVSGNFHVRRRDAGASARKPFYLGGNGGGSASAERRGKRWDFPLNPLQDSQKSTGKKRGEFSTNECVCESPRVCVCASENESGRLLKRLFLFAH